MEQSAIGSFARSGAKRWFSDGQLTYSSNSTAMIDKDREKAPRRLEAA